MMRGERERESISAKSKPPDKKGRTEEMSNRAKSSLVGVMRLTPEETMSLLA